MYVCVSVDEVVDARGQVRDGGGTGRCPTRGGRGLEVHHANSFFLGYWTTNKKVAKNSKVKEQRELQADK